MDCLADISSLELAYSGKQEEGTKKKIIEQKTLWYYI
jgi:hypothetical protein